MRCVDPPKLYLCSDDFPHVPHLNSSTFVGMYVDRRVPCPYNAVLDCMDLSIFNHYLFVSVILCFTYSILRQCI